MKERWLGKRVGGKRELRRDREREKIEREGRK